MDDPFELDRKGSHLLLLVGELLRLILDIKRFVVVSMPFFQAEVKHIKFNLFLDFY